jgi:predicted nucleic acid-binding protein
MKYSACRFIDANIIMYAIGMPHPLKNPCRAILDEIKNGSLQVVTNTEVLQEVLYRFYSLKRNDQAEIAYNALTGMCLEIISITRKDMDLSLSLLKEYPQITTRDAVHAATMINNEIEEIISTDSHFDLIQGIKRVKPET